MKKTVFLLAFVMLCFANFTKAQDVFDPADVLTNYPGSGTPAQPATGQIGKWYRTPKVNWNTDQFKSYIYNGMTFRLRYPNNYDKSDPSKKYPLILFFHGAGEIGPISDNEYQLFLGAKDFQDSINAGKFNAFMLFAQVSNSGWDYSYFEKLNLVLDTLKKYNNLDEDRVIPVGLSNGGLATLYYSIEFPRRSSVAIAASPALLAAFSEEKKAPLIHIPLFIANGGLDFNPYPPDVKKFVDSFTAKGGDVRQLFLPQNEHGTWLEQWNSGYLVNYWKNAHKANPLIFFQKNVFCPDSAISVKLGITAGFAQYQWQKDLVDMPTATGNEVTVNAVGSYRVRFRRVTNGAWSAWSPNPAVIAPRAAVATPDIAITGVKSRVLPAPDGSTTVPLQLPAGYTAYEWRRISDNAIVSTQRTFNAPVGIYKGLIAGCNRLFSNNFNVVDATGNPKPDAAINLAAVRPTISRVNLTWDLSRISSFNPTAYEVYRSTASGGALTLVAVLPSTQRTYSDTSGLNATAYYYKVRSVNETSAATLSNEATAAESTPPSTPAGLVVVNTGKTFVTLDWANSTDNIGVAGYDVFVNGEKKYSTTESAITADSLAPNTYYNFTVKARDISGNLSNASTAASTTTATLANGLKYRYYQGAWSLLPNFNTLTHISSGTSATPDLSVRTSGVNTNYGLIWEGYLVVPVTGNYTFELGTDDGSALYIDKFYSPSAVPTINADGARGETPTVSKVVTLTAGLHPIAMTYFQIAGLQSMNVFWTGPNLARQLIPASAYIETIPVVDLTAPTAPSSLVSALTTKTSVDLKWNASTDNIAVTGYNVYRNDTLKYTTSGSVLTVKADSLKSNTSYTFKVKAFDAAGNLSPFSNTLTVTTQALASGLTYKYYQGSWDSLPNFNTLTPIKTGTSANLDISVRPAGVNDYFGFVWEGYITIPASGTYTFELGTDDGSKLYWNSLYNPSATPLINNDFGHGETPTVSKSITIAAGVYPIAITYYEAWGGEAMNFFWTGPNISRQLVPNSAFIETAPIVDLTAPSVPGNMRVTYTGKNSVSLAWDNATDNVGVTGYEFYINNVLKTTSLSTTITVDTLTASTLYKFKVKARDAAGNLSAFSAEASTTTTASTSGLTYKYYEGNWNALPNFNTLTPVQTGVTANVDISVRPAGRDDYFAFLWEGKITIPASGTYTFELSSDDGSKLYIGAPYSPTATALVDNDFGHGETPTKSASITLTAGVYPIAISYFEIWGGQVMNVYWTKPNGVRELIPNPAFVDAGPDATPPTTPANFKTVYTGRTFIDLSWDNSTDAVGVTGYDVYVNASTTPVSTTNNTITIPNLTPNTAYTIKVQAKDAANNLSGFATVSTNSTASGLRYKYYEGDFNTLPNFNTLPLIKTGTTANIDVTPRRLNDYYAFVWEGYIRIPNTGNYTFELSSDDGSKFYFNTLYDPTATALVNNDGAHGETPTVSATRNITAGIYPVTITYFEKWGGELIQLYWSGPGISRQLVPTAAFTENFNVTLNGLINPSGLNRVEDVIPETAATQLKVKTFPNPFVNNIQVHVSNPVAGNHVTAVLTDITGRVIASKDFGAMGAGKSVLNIATGTELKPGIYMVRVNVNGLPSGVFKMVKERN